jgi:hypothetical protein
MRAHCSNAVARNGSFTEPAGLETNMPELKFESERPPLRVDPDGSIRIAKSRVLLPVLINAYRDWGWGAEQLARQYPTITLAEAHGVVAYYLNHRAEVDAYVDEWNAAGEREYENWRAQPETQALIAKLKARAARASA